MRYEINVSLNGMHFFATAERSITSESALRRVLPAIVAAFPKADGYEVTVTLWKETGHDVNIEKFLANNNE